jgi:hypothetical protein
MKKRQWPGVITLILMLAAIFGCDISTSPDPEPSIDVTLSNLTEFVRIQVEGRVVSAISIYTPQFTGTGVWQTGAGAPVIEFVEGGIYKAVITLTEKPGYTFSGVEANYFTHDDGTAANAAGSGNVTISFGAAPPRPAPFLMPPPASISRIMELNAGEPVIDSHANDKNVRHLELNRREWFRAHYSYWGSGAEQNHSARLKKLGPDKYIMFVQNNQVGATIWYSHSNDLEHWDTPKVLFQQGEPNEYIIYVGGNPTIDRKNWNTCDALKLQDGRLVAVATYFPGNNLRASNTSDGLTMRVSPDDGVTWGPEQVIFRGRNWEPHIIQLPPKNGERYGEIQVFCTSPATSYEIQYGMKNHGLVQSSGTAIVRSYDNGATWISHLPENEYYTYTVAQTWYQIQDGINKYTGQMPVAVQLHNGTAALALEDIRGGNNADGFGGNRISIAYSDNNWTEYAGPSSVWGLAQDVPSDRGEQLWQGSAPYIEQFPSGETLITYNVGNPNHPSVRDPTSGWNAPSFRFGDARARNFEGEFDRSYEPYQPYPEQGVYGALVLDASHTMLHTYSTGTENGVGIGRRDILIGRFQLNHTIFPGRKTGAGYNSEAFFIGSESQAQAAIRAAYDDDYLYLLVERLDDDLWLFEDVVDLYLHTGGKRTLDNYSLRLTVGQSGVVAAYRYSGGWEKETVENIKTAQKVIPGEGYTVEVAIPRAAISAKYGSVNIAFVLHNKDGAGPVIKDTLFNVDLDKPNTWLTMVTD